MSTSPGPQDPQAPQNPYGQAPGYGEQQPYGPPQPYGQPPAYGQPQSPAAPGYPAAYGPNPGTAANSLGVWALVLGIVSWVCSLGLFAGIPAIIVGNKSRRAAAEGRANNGGMGTAGVVLGWIATVVSLLVIVLFVILAATGNWEGTCDDSGCHWEFVND